MSTLGLGVGWGVLLFLLFVEVFLVLIGVWFGFGRFAQFCSVFVLVLCLVLFLINPHL